MMCRLPQATNISNVITLPLIVASSSPHRNRGYFVRRNPDGTITSALDRAGWSFTFRASGFSRAHCALFVKDVSPIRRRGIVRGEGLTCASLLSILDIYISVKGVGDRALF